GMYTAAGLRHRGAVTRLRLALATSVHARQGEYREAEDLCRDVLQQLTDAAAAGPQRALVHDELAGLFLAQAVKEADPAERARHLDAADAEIDDGLALRGPDHPAAADGRELKARVAEARGDLAAAEKISREVLAVREKAAAAPSRQADLGLAATASHLAEILHRQGKDAEAEQLFRQALALYRKVDGPDSVQAGLTLSLLGDMAREVGRLDDAARDYKAAVVVLRKSTGRGSPALALTLSSLRTTFRLIAGKALIEGRSADAQAAAERLIALLEELREPVTAEELHLLAGAYQAQGRYALAEKAGEQALDRLRREKNPDPVAKAQLVGFVAAACHLQDRYARAVELAREAVGLVRSLPKTEAPLAVAPLCVLAEAYRDLARYPEAEA